jgi:hypothetical protein
MPIAVNEGTGEVQYLDDAGAWQPARTAVNPDTKALLAHDGKDWVPVPAKSKGILGYIDDAVRSVASGVTFGFADEIAAKANELTGRGKDYETNLAAERARDKAIPAAIKIPGEIGGAVAGTIAAAPVTGAAAAATGVAKLPAFLRYIMGGATGGAMFGAGDAEGSRTEGAVKGGIIGAAAGATLPYVVGGAVRTGQALRNAVAPESGAAADLSRALVRDADTPESLAARAADLYATRPGVATLADAGGENVRGLLERVAQTPGAGRNIVVPALTERQKGQMGRIVGDLGELTGTNRTATQAVQQTMEDRAAAAKPLYDEAMNFNAREVPEIARVWDNATSTGWGKAVLESPDFKKTLQTVYGVKDVKDAPLMVQIDAWKKEVDGIVGEAVRAGNNRKAAVLSEMRDNVVKTLDEFNPKYADARNAWAGPSKFLDAIEEGRTILSPKMSAEETFNRILNMSDAEREAYRIGAVSALTGKMGNDAAKLGDMTKYIRSPEMRAKIAAIMPTAEAADKWFSRLDFETKASELTGRALGGPATARRLAEQQDAGGVVGDLVMDALTGTPAATLWHTVLRAGPQKIKDTLRSRTDERLGRLLTEAQDTSELARAFEKMGTVALPPSDATRNAATQSTNALANYYGAP